MSVLQRGSLEGLRGLNLALEQTADGHLSDGLDTSLGVFLDLVDADIVLAVAGRSKRRHYVRCGGERGCI